MSVNRTVTLRLLLRGRPLCRVHGTNSRRSSQSENVTIRWIEIDRRTNSTVTRSTATNTDLQMVSIEHRLIVSLSTGLVKLQLARVKNLFASFDFHCRFIAPGTMDTDAKLVCFDWREQ